MRHGIDPQLLSKHGQVVTALAHELVRLRPDDRVRRVLEFVAELDTSAGTVQAALDYLGSIGAAELEARGRLGTFARALNYPLLWSLAYNRPLVGVFPAAVHQAL